MPATGFQLGADQDGGPQLLRHGFALLVDPLLELNAPVRQVEAVEERASVEAHGPVEVACRQALPQRVDVGVDAAFDPDVVGLYGAGYCLPEATKSGGEVAVGLRVVGPEQLGEVPARLSAFEREVSQQQ